MDARTPSSDTAAIRAKRYRQRQRDGMIVLALQANEALLVDALVAMKLLKPEHIDNRLAIEHATQKMLDIFVKDESK